MDILSFSSPIAKSRAFLGTCSSDPFFQCLSYLPSLSVCLLPHSLQLNSLAFFASQCANLAYLTLFCLLITITQLKNVRGSRKKCEGEIQTQLLFLYLRLLFSFFADRSVERSSNLAGRFTIADNSKGRKKRNGRILKRFFLLPLVLTSTDIYLCRR